MTRLLSTEKYVVASGVSGRSSSPVLEPRAPALQLLGCSAKALCPGPSDPGPETATALLAEYGRLLGQWLPLVLPDSPPRLRAGLGRLNGAGALGLRGLGLAWHDQAKILTPLLTFLRLSATQGHKTVTSASRTDARSTAPAARLCYTLQCVTYCIRIDTCPRRMSTLSHIGYSCTEYRYQYY